MEKYQWVNGGVGYISYTEIGDNIGYTEVDTGKYYVMLKLHNSMGSYMVFGQLESFSVKMLTLKNNGKTEWYYRDVQSWELYKMIDSKEEK